MKKISVISSLILFVVTVFAQNGYQNQDQFLVTPDGRHIHKSSKYYGSLPGGTTNVRDAAKRYRMWDEYQEVLYGVNQSYQQQYPQPQPQPQPQPNVAVTVSVSAYFSYAYQGKNFLVRINGTLNGTRFVPGNTGLLWDDVNRQWVNRPVTQNAMAELTFCGGYVTGQNGSRTWYDPSKGVWDQTQFAFTYDGYRSRPVLDSKTGQPWLAWVKA